MAASNPRSLNEIIEGGSASFRRLNRGLTSQVLANSNDKPKPDYPVAPALPHTESKPHIPEALDNLSPTQKRSTRSAVKRPRVEIHLHRVKLLDTDNKWASVKPLLDAIRHAGLIPDDKETDIDLNVIQTQVAHYAQEGTGVVISWK